MEGRGILLIVVHGAWFPCMFYGICYKLILIWTLGILRRLKLGFVPPETIHV